MCVCVCACVFKVVDSCMQNRVDTIYIYLVTHDSKMLQNKPLMFSFTANTHTHIDGFILTCVTHKNNIPVL